MARVTQDAVFPGGEAKRMKAARADQQKQPRMRDGEESHRETQREAPSGWASIFLAYRLHRLQDPVGSSNRGFPFRKHQHTTSWDPHIAGSGLYPF